MSTVSRRFSVTPPPSVVIPYLADFGNAEQWDPGTVRCVREDDGPVQIGATWHNTSKLAGISTELTYTLEQLSERQVVLVGRNDTATSTETIDVTPDGNGSTVIYTNELHFNGFARLATPLAKLLFEKVGNDTERQLSVALNALAS
jgi:hypothetical protein